MIDSSNVLSWLNRLLVTHPAEIHELVLSDEFLMDLNSALRLSSPWTVMAVFEDDSMQKIIRFDMVNRNTDSQIMWNNNGGW